MSEPSKKQRTLSERQRRIYDFLRGTRFGVLASVDPEGEPHGVVIYHVVDETFGLSFITRKQTKKYDNLIKNNHVMLVVFEAGTQTVAQVTGKAVEIQDSNVVNDVAEGVMEAIITTTPNGMPPTSKLDAGDYAAFRIEPSQIRLASYARPDSEEFGIFESIESFDLEL